MLRRVLSIIVIIGFVAGRLAAIPHAHAEMNTDEHNQHAQTPHIHLHSSGADHHHGHSDSHDHDHLNPASDNQLCEDSNTIDFALISGNSVTDHDFDSVPLAPVGCDNSVSTQNQITADYLTAAAYSVVIERFETHGGPGNARIGLFDSPVTADSSELYLTLRTLRI